MCLTTSSRVACLSRHSSRMPKPSPKPAASLPSLSDAGKRAPGVSSPPPPSVGAWHVPAAPGSGRANSLAPAPSARDSFDLRPWSCDTLWSEKTDCSFSRVKTRTHIGWANLPSHIGCDRSQTVTYRPLSDEPGAATLSFLDLPPCFSFSISSKT